MSRVAYDPIVPGSTRDAGEVNSIFGAIAAVSEGIDYTNLAEEGIDAQPLAEGAGLQRFMLQDNSRETLVANGADFDVYEHGATQFRTGGLGSLAAGDALRIRSFVFLGTSLADGPGHDEGVNFRMCHQYNDGLTTIDVPGSVRGHFKIAGVLSHLHSAVYIESWIVGPVADIAWIQLAQSFTTGVLNAEQATLLVTEFRRIEVTTP